jgi:catechol 2,3-dioxygenase-like lactoylglutathione lyase family enzyme
VVSDPPGIAYPSGSTAADLWFQHCAIVTNDMACAYQRVARNISAPISQDGPQRLPPSTGSVEAYKFRDPDGHPLELIRFPEGVGAPAWQCPSVGPTLGIDHSALSVGDAECSLAFYARLGLVQSSRHLNTGPEQDRLDGLSEVAVDVIGLAPSAERTPHVELLCYHTPRGRSGAPSRRSHDIADSRLIFEVQDLASLVRTLDAAGARVSSVVELAPNSRAALVRDPDGHAIVLLEGHMTDAAFRRTCE